jgi:hypothetical protein
VEESDPLPVALYPQGCLFRSWAMQALDKANRPWRLAFVSHSLPAVEAITALGLAVTVVKSAAFPSRLRRRSERDGLPPLPRAEIRLPRAPKLSRGDAACRPSSGVADRAGATEGRAQLRFRTLRRIDHRHCSAAVRARRTEVVLAY